jgi:hypothetical protein
MLARAGGELRRDLEASGTNVGTLDIGHSGSQHAGSGRAGDHTGNAGTHTDRRAPAPDVQTSSRNVIRPLVTPTASRSTVADGVDVRI